MNPRSNTIGIFRRTGISLKEGRRDEHGMEEVDGLFSSPEKSPAGLPAFEEENASSTGSDEMSMDEGAPLVLSPEVLFPHADSPAQLFQAMRRIPWTSSGVPMAHEPLFFPRPLRGRQ